MPVLKLSDLPTFFSTQMFHSEEKMKKGGSGFENNKPYSRNPNSTWVYRMLHSGGINSLKHPFSCYIFFNEQPSIVVFKTSYRWIKKYSFINSPGSAYLKDISTVGSNIYYTTTLSEFLDYASSDPRVDEEIKIAAKYFKGFEASKMSLGQADSMRKDLGNIIKQIKKQIASEGYDPNKILPLDKLAEYKRTVNRASSIIKNPKAFMKQMKQKIINDINVIPSELKALKKGGSKRIVKTAANAAMMVVPGGKATKVATKVISKGVKINTMSRTVQRKVKRR